MLGITVAPSTVWEILKAEGVDPAPERAATTWAGFLRSPADALLAMDFIETITLTRQRQYILAVIEHATRRIPVLGTTAHPAAGWVTQAVQNLVMDLGSHAAYLIPRPANPRTGPMRGVRGRLQRRMAAFLAQRTHVEQTDQGGSRSAPGPATLRALGSSQATEVQYRRGVPLCLSSRHSCRVWGGSGLLGYAASSTSFG
ncbi:hypothetical protein ABZT51_44760, partial [Streptomyces sp. NPDC005373]